MNDQISSSFFDRPSSLSVVIPCYNEAETIVDVAIDACNTLKGLGLNFYEVIVVNDASTDSLDDLERVEATNEYSIKLVNHPENRGYGASLKTGIRCAESDVILIMDSDGQHSPQYIPQFLDSLAGRDLVIGCRNSNSSPLVRRPGKMFISFLVNFFLGGKVPDFNSGMRIFRKSTAKRYLHLCSNRFSFTTSQTMAFLSQGHYVSTIPIVCKKRTHSVSHLNYKAGLESLLKVIRLAVFFRPLRVFVPVSFFLIVMAIPWLIYDITQKNISDTTTLLLFNSMIVFFFGLLSDQIAHVRQEIK